jgi:hypothetical protein
MYSLKSRISKLLTYILCISDPPDEELRAAFEQFSREKSGSGLSANEQLMRLNEQFPELNIQYVCQTSFQPILFL